jgi:hypothetical protein
VSGGLLILGSLRFEPWKNKLVGYAFTFLYVFEIKSVAFSVNGMETGFMLLFLGWAFSLFERAGPRVWLARALCWAGLMWTRPDGCVYIAALSASGLVAGALYLPWFLFAWHYYGSPVPQTVLAKAPLSPRPFELGSFLKRMFLDLPQHAAQIFEPIYYPDFWAEPYWLHPFGYTFGIFCALYWLVPVADRTGRMASCCFAILTVYFSCTVRPAPWYLPPATLCGTVVLSRGIVTLGEKAARLVGSGGLLPRVVVALAPACFLTLATGLTTIFALSVRQIKIQQEEIEFGTRAEIGRWLKPHLKPRETVFLEPVGYIGYFSNACIRDWPGLVSPEIVRLRRNKVSFTSMIGAVKPDWAVLRHAEATACTKHDPFLRKEYFPVKVFDARPRLNAYGAFPGENYLLMDSVFVIFKKRAGPDQLDVPAEFRESALEARRYLPIVREPYLRLPRTSSGATPTRPGG